MFNNHTNEIKRISLNIRNLRKQKKITVQELAYRCNIERSNLSRIEAGKSNLTIKTLCIICNALDVEFSKIAVGVISSESHFEMIKKASIKKIKVTEKLIG